MAEERRLWLALAAATVVVHAVAIGHYGYFRDELYFIACAHHMAWGYVDQPPFAVVAAWLAGFSGYAIGMLRVLPVLAAAATVWLTCAFVGDLGGGRVAQALAGVSAMLSPPYLALGGTLVTTSFEPLCFTLVLWLTARVVRTNDRRLWLAVAAAVAFGLYAKYSMLLLAGAVVVSLACTRQRNILNSGWFLAGLALAVALVMPNLLWQANHGWPQLEVLRNEIATRHAWAGGMELEFSGWARNARAFAIEQALYPNPLLLPLWIAGLVALAFDRELSQYRFAAIAYAIVFVLAIAFEAKGYYIVGTYATLFAAGAVVVERRLRSHPALARMLVPAAIAVSLPLLPLALPVLPVRTLVAYTAALGLTGRDRTPPMLVQPLFAEEFGWDGLAQRVADAYRELPAAQRAHTGIFADSYGDASALNFYGPRYGLPPAVSGQNNFYLWGPGGYDGRSLIAVGATQTEALKRSFGSVRLLGTFVDPYRRAVEGPDPIWLCTKPREPFDRLWANFKWFGA